MGYGAGLFSKGREPTSACLNLEKSLVFSVVLTVIILSKAEAKLKKDHKVCLVAAFKNKKGWLCTMLSTAGSPSFSTSVSIPASFSAWFFISLWLLTLAFCLLGLLLVLKKEKCLLALIVGDGFTIFLSVVLIRF